MPADRTMHRIHPDLPHLPVTLSPGVTLLDVIERVEDARGKPLRIQEVPELADNGTLCGLWLSTPTEDIVLHAPSDSALHREQFILHELAHILLLHDKVDAKTGYVTDSVLPHFDNATVVKALARDTLDDRYELLAEQLADTLARFIRNRADSRFSEIFG